mgnify:CR=1 FL=1
MIIFVKSAENDADVFTKNVSYEILRRFRDNFVIAKEMISNPGVVNGQGGCQDGHYTTPGSRLRIMLTDTKDQMAEKLKATS